MLEKRSLRKRCVILVLLVFGLLLGAAWAQTESVLYSFCTQGCTDGADPYTAPVVVDQKGNLYGTTYYGGVNQNNQQQCSPDGCGVAFKVTPDGKETVLYTFCTQDNCTDGASPEAGPALDQKGNLYGTTYYGGAYDGCNPLGGYGCGVVFKLTPKGKETVLYNFCAQTNCTDGTYPSAGLIFDQKGNLYGTTITGGAIGGGVVFKLSPEGKETVLYSFCAQTNCADGSWPVAGLVFDQKGNLYGTTAVGGAYDGCYPGGLGCGVAFKLTPEGRETVLYSFCAQINCTDGANPAAGLVFDQKGKLYGTTASGGDNNNGYCSYGGCGVVFKLTPKGKETVLHAFCAQNDCADGASPGAGLIFGQKGKLYGTTGNGGAYNRGVVFKLTP